MHYKQPSNMHYKKPSNMPWHLKNRPKLISRAAKLPPRCG